MLLYHGHTHQMSSISDGWLDVQFMLMCKHAHTHMHTQILFTEQIQIINYAVTITRLACSYYNCYCFILGTLQVTSASGRFNAGSTRG